MECTPDRDLLVIQIPVAKMKRSIVNLMQAGDEKLIINFMQPKSFCSILIFSSYAIERYTEGNSSVS